MRQTCRLLGAASRWAGYLRSLPQKIVDIALLWGSSDQLPQGRDQGRRKEDREDDRQARAWAAGTELQNELKTEGENYALVSVEHRLYTVAFADSSPITLPSRELRSFGLSGRAFVTPSTVYRHPSLHSSSLSIVTVFPPGRAPSDLSPLYLRALTNFGLQDEVREYFVSVTLPILSRHMLPSSISFSGFLQAYSLVSSRAFLVDAYHGLSMVPIADA